jgi:hypothetical protein
MTSAWDLLYLINVGCVFISWKVAQSCDQWSMGWWLNMFASALNAAIILHKFI